jgi:hypothetical protein
MKNLTILFFALFLTVGNTAFANASSASSTTSNCTWNSWFKYPKNNGNYEEGKSVYVRVDPRKYHDIQHMELFINGKFVRKESRYPYEWCKGSGNSDSYLRNLHPGTYKLKCRVLDKCGKRHEIYSTFFVKGTGNGHCEINSWFKYPKNGGTFQEGKTVYVRVDPKKYHDIHHMELFVNGKFVRKESRYPYEWAKANSGGDHILRNMRVGTYKLVCKIFDKCGYRKEIRRTIHVGGGGNHCNYKSWYKYPKNNGTYRYGDDVYVRVDTEKYQDIEKMELFVNGKFVRKESHYPYEWCKGNGNSDGYLRNLKRGTYNLKCRVKTKCGKWYEYFCKFYVR